MKKRMLIVTGTMIVLIVGLGAYIERALRDSRGNKSRAARQLGLTRAQLYSRLDKYGLTR